ncbi:hypothetical protein ACQP0C_00605 [Nocardia sp. CA-129566]|uniref:hypothetical protein n=1 Tax=Nocardia sp. CA-129566 TaxID=3239976 RepID=UPI003D989D4C
MSTNKARGNAPRRLFAKTALIGAAMTVPMMPVAAPAMAAPTPGPGVVQTDCDFDFDLDFDSGFVDDNQWTGVGKPWGGHGNPWGGHGKPWGGWGHGKPWGGWGCGWGGPWLFPPGWFGSS